MQDTPMPPHALKTYAPPHVPATGRSAAPPCPPRRLHNERTYRQPTDEKEEAPLTGARKMRLRYVPESTPMTVKEAGMVPRDNLSGTMQS